MKVMHIWWNLKPHCHVHENPLSLHWPRGPCRTLASMQEPNCSYLRWMNWVHIFPLAKVVCYWYPAIYICFLQVDSFPQFFWQRLCVHNCVCMFLLCDPCMLHFFLHMIILIIFGEDCKLWSCLLYYFLESLVIFILFEAVLTTIVLYGWSVDHWYSCTLCCWAVYWPLFWMC